MSMNVEEFIWMLDKPATLGDTLLEASEVTIQGLVIISDYTVIENV